MLLVKQSRHLDGLDLAPVLLEDLLEYALSGSKPGGGGASNVAMRRHISIPCGSIPISVTQDAHVGAPVGWSGIVLDVKMLLIQLEVVVREHAHVELLVSI